MIGSLFDIYISFDSSILPTFFRNLFTTQVRNLSSRPNHFFLVLSLNRIPVMAPILAPILGVHFWGSIFSSKMGPFAPFPATIQALSRTRAFLQSENERKLLCMGHTFTVARPYLVNNCPKHVVCQLGIESSSCKS
jgi:hypothetical protein